MYLQTFIELWSNALSEHELLQGLNERDYIIIYIIWCNKYQHIYARCSTRRVNCKVIAILDLIIIIIIILTLNVTLFLSDFIFGNLTVSHKCDFIFYNATPYLGIMPLFLVMVTLFLAV